MKDTVLAATRDLVAAVDDLHGTVRERMPAPAVEARGYQSWLSRPRAVVLALRFGLDAEGGESLASRLRPVPEAFLRREPDGRVVVSCLCEAEHERGELVECPGGCGRVFVGDVSGVWAARLDEAGGSCACREAGRARRECLTAPACLEAAS